MRLPGGTDSVIPVSNCQSFNPACSACTTCNSGFNLCSTGLCYRNGTVGFLQPTASRIRRSVLHDPEQHLRMHGV